MQFEVSKNTLLKAISNVNGAVEKKNTIPVLQNIRIDVNNQITEPVVSLSATDMDVLITSKFKADIVRSGSTTVSAQMFFDIVRKVPENTEIVIMQDSPNILQIRYGKSKFNLPCIDPSEFPDISEGDLGEQISIAGSTLGRMIDKTRFAISNDETRYHLNGIYLQLFNNPEKANEAEGKSLELRTVATDGHRLSLSFLEIDCKIPFGVIIPKKTVAEIRRVVEGVDNIIISVSDIKIKLVCGDTTIISKLIDGDFPPYDKVVPKNNNQIVIVNKKSLFDSVDRVATIATDKHRSIKLNFENNKLVLQATSSESGFAYEEIDISYSGEPIETGFNARYLLDIINQIDKEELMIRFKDGLSPAIIEAKELSSLFVIMPIRV